jgi:DNA-binding HxlR family transcriptional regulator
MAQQTTNSGAIDVTLSLIAGKWKSSLLNSLHLAEKRSYSDLKRAAPGISEKMLSQQLKELHKNKLIDKRVLSEKPYRVEYFLTEQGKSLANLCTIIGEWGDSYLNLTTKRSTRKGILYGETTLHPGHQGAKCPL